MEIINSDKSARTSLWLVLNNLTKSFIRRNIAFVVTAHSDKVATVQIIVTGKKGSVNKNVAIMYNDITKQWEGHCDGTLYLFTSITEFAMIVKTTVVKLSTLVTKVY